MFIVEMRECYDQTTSRYFCIHTGLITCEADFTAEQLIRHVRSQHPLCERHGVIRGGRQCQDIDCGIRACRHDLDVNRLKKRHDNIERLKREPADDDVDEPAVEELGLCISGRQNAMSDQLGGQRVVVDQLADDLSTVDNKIGKVAATADNIVVKLDKVDGAIETVHVQVSELAGSTSLIDDKLDGVRANQDEQIETMKKLSADDRRHIDVKFDELTRQIAEFRKATTIDPKQVTSLLATLSSFSSTHEAASKQVTDLTAVVQRLLVSNQDHEKRLAERQRRDDATSDPTLHASADARRAARRKADVDEAQLQPDPESLQRWRLNGARLAEGCAKVREKRARNNNGYAASGRTLPLVISSQTRTHIKAADGTMTPARASTTLIDLIVDIMRQSSSGIPEFKDAASIVILMQEVLKTANTPASLLSLGVEADRHSDVKKLIDDYLSTIPSKHGVNCSVPALRLISAAVNGQIAFLFASPMREYFFSQLNKKEKLHGIINSKFRLIRNSFDRLTSSSSPPAMVVVLVESMLTPTKDDLIKLHRLTNDSDRPLFGGKLVILNEAHIVAVTEPARLDEPETLKYFNVDELRFHRRVHHPDWWTSLAKAANIALRGGIAPTWKLIADNADRSAPIEYDSKPIAHQQNTLSLSSSPHSFGFHPSSSASHALMTTGNVMASTFVMQMTHCVKRSPTAIEWDEIVAESERLVGPSPPIDIDSMPSSSSMASTVVNSVPDRSDGHRGLQHDDPSPFDPPNYYQPSTIGHGEIGKKFSFDHRQCADDRRDGVHVSLKDSAACNKYWKENVPTDVAETAKRDLWGLFK